ncbi:MAG: dihydrolipoyl dehydrogenase [Opitutales bacterium]|nr:dihydrolipoyl dehydrogenase [Opitutales bacterium]
MKRESEFDFVVIGGGSAGYNAANLAASQGARVAVIDGAQELGGLCILRGCMPSKTLIYSAEVLHLAQKGETFGLDIPKAQIDMKKLAERKKNIIGDFASYRREGLHSGRFTLFNQKARFADPQTVELEDGCRITGKTFLIATGSEVQFPPIPGLDKVPVWTSDDVLDLDFLPESVLVLGGGVVACELAQFLARAGSNVTQIQRSPHLLKEMSEEAAQVVETVFREEGIELFTNTRIEDIKCHGQKMEVTFMHEGKKIVRQARHLFNALGRVPKTKGLDLPTAGVETGSRGEILVNGYQQTNQPHIYAAGDCIGKHEIVHIAIQQGETAARHALGKKTDEVDYRCLMGVVFTDPQVAYVGALERELKERGQDYVAADYPFDDHGKSILMEIKHGFVKILASPADRRLLGAEIVGKDASELIHVLSTALHLKATVDDLLRAPWYHPTLVEILTYPLEDLQEALDQK